MGDLGDGRTRDQYEEIGCSGERCGGRISVKPADVNQNIRSAHLGNCRHELIAQQLQRTSRKPGRRRPDKQSGVFGNGLNMLEHDIRRETTATGRSKACETGLDRQLQASSEIASRGVGLYEQDASARRPAVSKRLA